MERSSLVETRNAAFLLVERYLHVRRYSATKHVPPHGVARVDGDAMAVETETGPVPLREGAAWDCGRVDKVSGAPGAPPQPASHSNINCHAHIQRPTVTLQGRHRGGACIALRHALSLPGSRRFLTLRFFGTQVDFRSA